MLSPTIVFGSSYLQPCFLLIVGLELLANCLRCVFIYVTLVSGEREELECAMIQHRVCHLITIQVVGVLFGW